MHYSGHFQSYYLLLLVIYVTAGAPNRVFSCASSFSMVNGSIETKFWRKIEKNLKNPYFSQFPWLDVAIFMPKICLNWPNMVHLVPRERYFDGQVCFFKFLGPLNGEYWREMRKKSKNQFFMSHFRLSRSVQDAKNLI